MSEPSYRPGGPERRQPPDRRKEDYDKLDEKIDGCFDILTKRLGGFFTKALIAFAVLGMSCALALLGFSIVLQKQADITDRIQQQRYDSLVQTCTDTNERNKDVNSKIDAAVSNIPDVPPGRRAKAKKAAAPFRLIISAAVPVQKNCHVYAEQRLKGEN